MYKYRLSNDYFEGGEFNGGVLFDNFHKKSYYTLGDAIFKDIVSLSTQDLKQRTRT